MPILKPLVILLSTMLFNHAVFGQELNLGFKLAAGETYFYSMQSASHIEQEINGQQTEIKMTEVYKLIDNGQALSVESSSSSSFGDNTMKLVYDKAK